MSEASSTTGRTWQPKATRYRTLALLWLFPSFGALWILVVGCRKWLQGDGLFAALTRVRAEEWVALLLLAAQIFFAVRARHWREHEAFVEIPPDPPEDEDEAPPVA